VTGLTRRIQKDRALHGAEILQTPGERLSTPTKKEIYSKILKMGIDPLPMQNPELVSRPDLAENTPTFKLRTEDPLFHGQPAIPGCGNRPDPIVIHPNG
jgi:hypothetical protein